MFKIITLFHYVRENISLLETFRVQKNSSRLFWGGQRVLGGLHEFIQVLCAPISDWRLTCMDQSPLFLASNWAKPTGGMGCPGGTLAKILPASSGNARDSSSSPGWETSPGEGNGNTLQYPCLENSMDRGAWQATIHGVAKSQTRLSIHTHSMGGTGRI